MTTSAVEKALVQLIKSSITLEEYGERLVRASVIHTIHEISDLYGLNREFLEARFVESAVASLAKCTAHEGKCKAITYRNKRCTQDAVEEGLCPLHKKQQVGDGSHRISHRKKRHKGHKGARVADDVATSVMALLDSL